MNTNTRKIEIATANVAKLRRPSLKEIMDAVKPAPEFVSIVEGPRVVNKKLVKVTGTLVFNWKTSIPSEHFATLAEARKAKEAYEIQNASSKKAWEILMKDSAFSVASEKVQREFNSTRQTCTDALTRLALADARKDLSRL